MSYLKDIIWTAVPALILWGILSYSIHKDRSRYRNCSLFMITVLFTLPVIVHLAGPYSRPVRVFLLFLILLGILLVPVFLIANGVVMLRREGHSFKNLLSLFLGIVVELGEISSLLFAIGLLRIYDGRPDSIFSSGRLPLILLLISLSVVYFSMSFLSFACYSLFLEIIPRKRDFDYVIIHGSGLIGGDKISKLLSDRLDKAIEVYHKDPTPPILIPSGGKGSDEAISEGEAMAEYLIEHGIPEDHVIAECTSKTTRENLINSKKIIDERPGEHYTALVTSNYHVFRALRYCRSIGFTCTGIGAHVAGYYWPSALIREYAAIHSKGKQLILLLAPWIVFIVIPMVWLIL
ncbi:MAG: YdcF family protein [Lachnospiraceae bacterium]|nr:YdcF family protein [Lachnospiraceae bacterium]